jgi:hypothetical protein
MVGSLGVSVISVNREIKECEGCCSNFGEVLMDTGRRQRVEAQMANMGRRRWLPDL